jgi:hypothetical protein
MYLWGATMHPFQILKFYLSTVVFDISLILFHHILDETRVPLCSYDTGDRPIDGTFCRLAP